MGAREGEAARKGKRQEREQIKQNVTSRVCFLLPKAAIQHASSSSTCVCARVRACERGWVGDTGSAGQACRKMAAPTCLLL